MNDIAATPDSSAGDETAKIPDKAASLLLVDDEPGILSSLRRLLRPIGYKIHTAESGKAGLDILEQEPIDLVISDMRMPEMDGAHFLEQVRKRWPATTRILLTGYADVTSTIEAINRGEIYRYIAKPWDDNDLTLIVRDALERLRLQNDNIRLLALTQAQNEELKDLNANLEEKVRQRTQELQEANEKLKQRFVVSIKLFTGLMELRGGPMAGHSRRVADMARKLASVLGLSIKEQQDIFLASLLHDVGKIGFPDTQLARPLSKMNSEELTRYRKHTIVGQAALMPLDDLKEVAQIVRSHHERFDGQGFPDRLQAMAIPLGARILSVVNDYDGLQLGTLAEKRMNPDEAKTTIGQSRGKRYDPHVVDTFVTMLGGMPREIIVEKTIPYTELKIGMKLSRDLIGLDGVLLLAAEFYLDESLISQIQDYANREDHNLKLYIHMGKR